MQFNRSIVGGGLCAAAVFACSMLVSAGPLTPPAGPVSETMKPLDEVEPRVAVNVVNTPGDVDALFVITQPGSYYLTGNILGVTGKHGIEITSKNVTLDLSGFEVRGVAGSLSGINLSIFMTSVTVRNGVVSNWGQNGVLLRTDGGYVEDIRAVDNKWWGIDSSSQFSGRISNCNVYRNGLETSRPGGGITAGSSVVVENCSAAFNDGFGIDVGSASIVRSCAVWNTDPDPGAGQDGSGIVASGGLIDSCTSTENGGSGIRMTLIGVTRGCNLVNNTGLNLSDVFGSLVVDTLTVP